METAFWTNSLDSSPTILLNARVQELKAKGEKIISLVVGEPDFETPLEIKNELKKALDNNFTKYTSSEGILPLRKAICEKLSRHNGLIYKPENIVVTSGAKQAISTALMAIINPGEEVIFAAPYWVSYPEMVKISRGVPKIIETDESCNFKITASMLEKNISKKTKALLLCSPSNPTGVLYTKKELEALIELCSANKIYIISDEIYERIVFSGKKFYSTAAISKKAYDITITINGLSKSHAMTGWRVGYLAAPYEVAKVVNNIQSHFLSHIASFIQVASIKAFELDNAVTPMVEAYEKRLDLACKLFDELLPNCPYVRPDGAFYIFPKTSYYYGKTLNGKKITGSLDLAEAILDHGKTAIVPGIAFGTDNNIRISLASSENEISEGIKSIARVLNQIKA